LIYALEANGRTLALTDDPDAATKLNINVFTRWVTPAEASTAGSGAAQAVAGASVALVAVARSALLGSLVT